MQEEQWQEAERFAGWAPAVPSDIACPQRLIPRQSQHQ
jgi:hypothetical protein